MWVIKEVREPMYLIQPRITIMVRGWRAYWVIN